jgi:hypothetical protein
LTAANVSAALLCLAAWAAAADTYAGAATCRSCHPSQFNGQSAGGHARTLHRAAEHPLAARFASDRPLRRSPGLRYDLLRREDGFAFRIGNAEAEMEIPVEWAFGSGTHGVTFVSRLGPDSWLEHAFSYFTRDGSLDLTPGHRELPARSLLEAAGQLFRLRGGGFTIRSCFECHSTGPVSVSAAGGIEVAETGVRCEACHGPASAHVEAAAASHPRRAQESIRNPRALSADDLNRFCGSCHRSPEGGLAANDFTNPWNVRHQPPYLEQSRCFTASAGALSCLTCHPPHEPLRRADPAYYSAGCAACHTPDGAHPPAQTCLAPSSADCTACHMPAVAADPHLSFRNHWIGVYRGDSVLMPELRAN